MKHPSERKRLKVEVIGNKKVLIVHNYYQIPGGEDTVVRNEMELLKKHGNGVVLYSRNNMELSRFSLVKKILMPVIFLFNPRTYRDVKKIIDENHIDIVHVHNIMSLISPSVYFAAFKSKVPVVQTMHNFRLLCPAATFYNKGIICEDCVNKGLQCAVVRKCYRESRMNSLACVVSTVLHRMLGTYSKINYICLSDFNKEKLLCLNKKSSKWIINPDKVYIKPNFTFEPSEKKEENVGEYYLYIGRVERIKGLGVLLDAFKQMPDIKLQIAGTGKDMGYYQQYVAENHMLNVNFAGYLEKAELDKYLFSAKAVIVPSQWYETFGMIIIEAYAAHKPVIVGNIGNIASLVDENKTGLKFQYDSSDSLVQTVRKFEKHYNVNWNNNAYKKYLDLFSPERNYELLMNIYETIINKHTHI